MLSHRMITWNAINTQISWGLRETDSHAQLRALLPRRRPQRADYADVHLRRHGRAAAHQSIPPRSCDAIAAERCTLVFAVPTVFQTMMDHPRFADDRFLLGALLRHGRLVVPAAGDPWLRGARAEFRQGYGLTEVGVNCFSLAPEDALRKAGSVGRPVFHSRARVVDDDDRDVAPGEVGELVLAGPHVCSGYWRRPEATAEAYRDGWWHTGDLVRRDAEGYYYIVGRKKDMYISGGENVYPAEVEAVLATHPASARSR